MQNPSSGSSATDIRVSRLSFLWKKARDAALWTPRIMHSLREKGLKQTVVENPEIPIVLFTLASLWPALMGGVDFAMDQPHWGTKFVAGVLKTAGFAYMLARAKKDGYATGTLINTIGFHLIASLGFNDPDPASRYLNMASLGTLYFFNTPLVLEHFLSRPAKKLSAACVKSKNFITRKVAPKLLWPFAEPRKFVGYGGLICQSLFFTASYLTPLQQDLTPGFFISLVGCALVPWTKTPDGPKQPEVATTAGKTATTSSPPLK